MDQVTFTVTLNGTDSNWGPKYRTEKAKLVDEIIRKIKKGNV